jgi:hypothetical protein
MILCSTRASSLILAFKILRCGDRIRAQGDYLQVNWKRLAALVDDIPANPASLAIDHSNFHRITPQLRHKKTTIPSTLFLQGIVTFVAQIRFYSVVFTIYTSILFLKFLQR